MAEPGFLDRSGRVAPGLGGMLAPPGPYLSALNCVRRSLYISVIAVVTPSLPSCETSRLRILLIGF